MPATRSNPRVKSNAAASSTRNHPFSSDNEVIVISSDEEDVSSTGYALKKAQQEIRSLKKKLAKEVSSSKVPVLSDQRNQPADSMSSSSRPNKQDEERRRLESRLQQANTDAQEWQNQFWLEKEARSVEVAQLKKQVKAAEKELQNLKAKNKELISEASLLRENIRMGMGARNNNNALASLENHILCEVCTEKLWQPFLLSGCGHTFCQGCLVDWFNTAMIKNAQNPQYTCPTCRARVYREPIEDYALKGVVRAISHAIDPTGGSPSPPPRNHGRGPWYRFFG